MKDMWNKRYSEQGYAYGESPNVFFAERLGDPLRPEHSRILLPAEGEGRNAVHAARTGWRVHAFDSSSAGRAKAMALAARHGVELDYDIAGYANAEFEAGAYDALGLVFAHMHEDRRRAMHRRLAGALAPGGRVILEAYAKPQLNFGTGGPPVEAMLYDPEQLREDFEGFEILELEQLETEIVEGKYHTGMACVVRLIAQRS